ncbi:MAG: CvpA family protein [Erysipelotrichaceae bacterium]
MTLSSNSVLFINIGVIAFLVISMIIGYIRGFLWQVIKTIGILAVILLSWILAPGFSDLIKIFPKKYAPFQDTVLADVFYEKINVLVWFVIIFIVGVIIIAIIKPLFKVVLEFPIIKQFNSLLGAVFALIPSFMIVILITFLLNTAIFTNGKDIIDNSILKYTDTITEKITSILSKSFKENVAIQKMISDPLSLEVEDIKSIIDWLKKSSISSEDIYEFLINYGLDVDKLNQILNPGE